MSEEIEKTSGDQSKGKETNTLDQDDISKLLDEMQGEENSPETEDQAEKITDDAKKQESDETKDDKGEGEEPTTLNQDDISKLIDEVQGEEKSSETQDQAEKTTDDAKKKESDETKDDKGEGEEPTTLNQDDISKLIDEVQGEEKSSETEDQAEKTTDDAKKQEPDETKDDEGEGEEPTTINNDDISKLIDDVKSEAKSPEAEETKDTTENVEKNNEGGKNDDTEMTEDENTQTAESNDDNDEEDNGSFKGLDSNDEIEIDGDPGTEPETKPETEKDESNNEESDNKIKKNDEEKNKKSKKDDGGGQAVILKDVKKRFRGKRFKLLISSILCLVFIGVSFGAYKYFKKSGPEIMEAEKLIQTEQIAKPENKYSEEQTRQQIKANETKEILLSDSIIAKLEEITKLRNELLIKEGEIADLINNHKNGISEMEDQLLGVKQNNQINSFSVAIKNKKIEFGMMTIQRRLAYIDKIEPPYEWLNQGIEELLYLKRKIEIDARISRVISGIDMDKMIQEVDIVIQSYRNGIEKLKIDMKNVELMSLEMIWKRVIDKEKFTAENNIKTNEPFGINKSALRNEETNNRIIWQEISSGNFKRKNEMTNLSTEAAKNLSKWKHADLFLNGLSELSPNVARYLLKWQGNWICLNGVKKLSPQAAKYLFQWHGNWISLNGISEISSGLLRYLPHWQGKQLELMGLKYKKTKSEQVGLKALAKWEKSGGKLYISVQIRKIIDHI